MKIMTHKHEIISLYVWYHYRLHFEEWASLYHAVLSQTMAFRRPSLFFSLRLASVFTGHPVSVVDEKKPKGIYVRGALFYADLDDIVYVFQELLDFITSFLSKATPAQRRHHRAVCLARCSFVEPTPFDHIATRVVVKASKGGC